MGKDITSSKTETIMAYIKDLNVIGKCKNDESFLWETTIGLL